VPTAYRPKGYGRFIVMTIPADLVEAHSWIKPGLQFKMKQGGNRVILEVNPGSFDAKTLKSGNAVKLQVRDIPEGIYDIEVKDKRIILTYIEEGYVVQATKYLGDSVRTTIPAALARKLGIKSGDKFRVKVVANRIVFEPLGLENGKDLIPVSREVKEKLEKLSGITGKSIEELVVALVEKYLEVK